MEIIERMYNQLEYKELLSYYHEKGIQSHEERVILSFVLLEVGSYFEAMECIKSIDLNVVDRKYKGKFLRYKALIFFYFNLYDDSLKLFEMSMDYGDQESVLWKKLLFVKIKRISTVGNLTFRFVNEIDDSLKKIIIFSGMMMYKKMRDFFGYDFEKKIDIYIYDQQIDALGNNLSYTDNGMKNIYLYIRDSISHEIVHLFANSIYTQMNRNMFIDEGIATYLSDGLAYDEYIKKHGHKFIRFNVIDAWQNGFDISDMRMRDSYYLVAGALIGFLLKEFGKGMFLEFIQDESLEHAKKVYGDDLLNRMILFSYDIDFK